MELIIFFTVMTVIAAIICIYQWIDIFRHPDMTTE